MKDACLLPGQGIEFIGLVQGCDYAQCWQLANSTLLRRDPGYSKVDPVRIKPEWLA